MLDSRKLKQDMSAIRQALAKKKFELDEQLLEELMGSKQKLQLETESLQQTRNQESKAIGQAKAAGNEAEAESHKKAAEEAKSRGGRQQREST